jgi:glycosyltransferase involved in cell wall biosynthesis
MGAAAHLETEANGTAAGMEFPAPAGVRAKILIVTGIFPPDAGGPASYVPRLAAALSRRGHRIEVVTLSDRLDHDDGVWPFPVHRIRRRLFWPWRILVTILTIWRLSRDKDVVYVNGLGSEAALGAWLAGRPAVHKIVGDYAWERAQTRGWFLGTLDEFQETRKTFRLRLLGSIRTLPLRSARRVIVPSEYLRRIVTGWGIPAEQVRVIYNAAAGAGRESPRAARSSRPRQGTTLVTVCRLVPWKGVDALIRVVAADPDTRLLIAGDGALRESLQALAHCCGAADRVTFLGQVPQADVRALLEQADVFVLNSTYEGLPHVVLEAMEAGTPVVATNAGGTGEVVEHEVTGLLVPPGDEAALAAAIKRLRADPALAGRLVAGARRRLDTRLSFDAMVDQTEALLEECAGAGRGLSVLSLGFTRGLWEGEGAEDYQRLLSYGAHLDRYVLVTISYKRHHLTRRQLAANVEGIPTNGFSPVDSLMRMFWLGAQALRQRRASLIQAQDPCYSGLAGALLARLFRLPLVVCVYGSNVYDPHWLRSHWSHRLLAPIGRWVLGRARCIQVDGRLTARSLIAAGHASERVEVKPVVPANLGSFLGVHRNGARLGNVPRFLYTGRLARQKNLPLLLRAVKQVRALGCPFELLLVGAGPEEQALRRLCERDGLGDCVRFCAPVSRAAIVRVFAEADVFVLSSDYEGYPRVLMEAAAAALPVVTTAVSGSDDAVVDGESGFIVPVGRLEPLVARLAQLAGDPALRARMGQAGRKHIAGQLDPATNAPRQLAIWRKVTQ